MAKLKNRIKNKINKNNRNSAIKAMDSSKLEALKPKMEQYIADRMYSEAMDVMAEIAQAKMLDTDVMYMGAYCYEMTDDDDRAIIWIDHVLKYDPNHVKARILLGKICLKKDDIEKGMGIFTFLLEKKFQLSDDDRKDLEDILEYYRYVEAEMLREKYPVVAEFLGLEPKQEEEVSIPVVEAKCEDEVEDNKPEEPAALEPEQDDSAARARAAVERLRALLSGRKAEQEKVEEQPVNTVCQEEEITEEIIEEEIEEIDESEEDAQEEQADNEFDVAGTIQQIMVRSTSLKDKIKMLNSFAGGCYVNGDYQSAFDLLNAALEIDSSDPVILKNIAYVCVAADEKQQAMEFAAKLPMIDFALLNAIN